MTARDIISRDVLKRLTTDLARHFLELDAEAIEVLETQNQRIEDRRADLVARMRRADGEEFLLHIEIANNNKADMPLRMLRYYYPVSPYFSYSELSECAKVRQRAPHWE